MKRIELTTRRAPARSGKGLATTLFTLMLAVPLAVACSGTATVKTPAGGVDLSWDTTRPEEIWYALEELIELNLEFLQPSTAYNNPAAVQLAMSNIEQATALKDKLAERIDSPQTSVN